MNNDDQWIVWRRPTHGAPRFFARRRRREVGRGNQEEDMRGGEEATEEGVAMEKISNTKAKRIEDYEKKKK